MKYRDLGQSGDDRLPQPPVLTPEQLTANDEQQKLWRTSQSVSISPSNLYAHRAMAVIFETEKIPQEYLSPFQRNALREAFTTLGRFEDAAKIAEDEAEKAELLALAEVVARKDKSLCDCPNTVTAQMNGNRAEQVTISRFFRRRKIFIGNEWRDLMECGKCGFRVCK